MMEEKQQSPLLATLSEAMVHAVQLKTKSDSVLMLVTDGNMALRLVGGQKNDLVSILTDYMKKNAQVAEIVYRASLAYQADVLHLSPPPLPKDGIAEQAS